MILELSWRHNIMDFAMPYMIQVIRECTTKIEKLEQSDAQRQQEKAEEQKPMMINEPQLMLMAGTGMGIPQQPMPNVAPGYMPQGYAPQGYAPPAGQWDVDYSSR